MISVKDAPRGVSRRGFRLTGRIGLWLSIRARRDYTGNVEVDTLETAEPDLRGNTNERIERFEDTSLLVSSPEPFHFISR
jgi:hypothetical protein